MSGVCECAFSNPRSAGYLLHAIAVVNVNVDIEHTWVISEAQWNRFSQAPQHETRVHRQTHRQHRHAENLDWHTQTHTPTNIKQRLLRT